jgi:hypothetical protein
VSAAEERQGPPCHRCGKPLPAAWFWVLLCDPCLIDALVERGLPDVLEAVTFDREETASE